MSIVMGLIIITACQKDKELNMETVTTNILGRIVDENGMGIYEAKVSIGTTSVKTDLNGIFIIKNIQAVKGHAYIKVNKENYIEGSRAFTPIPNGTNQIKIILLSRNLSGTFSAATGGAINAGVTLTFPANSITDNSGNPYTGSVSVYTKYLDPTDNKLQFKMPGDLKGQNTEGNERILQTFGMLNVELEDPAGNKLHIANGSEVTMSMQVPASLLSNAPASIPLWYFDNISGMWKEEGSATLTGNTYVGNVKHFSWWNYDVPKATVILSLQITDENGNSLPDMVIKLTNLENGDSRTATTDQKGKISGYVYADVVMKMEYTDACGNIVFIKNIGPLQGNLNNKTAGEVNLGDIPLLLNTTPAITGDLIDCNGDVVSYGYVKILLNNQEHYIYSDVNGHFKFNYCGTPSSLNIDCYDFASFSYITTIVTPTAQGKDIGDITLPCNSSITSDQYLIYHMDNSFTYLCDTLVTRWDQTSVVEIVGSKKSNNINEINDILISFRDQNISSGLVEIDHIFLRQRTPVGADYSIFNYQPDGPIAFKYFAKTPGEYYEGSFSTRIYYYAGGNTFIPHTIVCKFRVKRQHV